MKKPMTRRAVRFHSPCDARLTEEALEPLQPDELRCHALHSLISGGTERIQFIREFDATMHRNSELAAPYCSGYSMTAEVIEVGSAVTGYKAGDRIYTTANHKEYFNVKAADPNNSLLPSWMPSEEACWTTLLQTGLFACEKGEIRHTDTVLILGAGMFGLCTLQFACLKRPRRIVVCDPSAWRCELARKLGADEVICADACDIFDTIYETTGGRLCDVVIDATDSEKVLAAACDLTRTHGHLVVIADPSHSDSWRVATGFRNGVGTGLLGGSLNIHGLYIKMMTEDPNPFYPVTVDEVHQTIFEFIHKGYLNVKAMTTAIDSPAHCQAMFQQMVHGYDGYMGFVYDWRALD